MVLIAVCEIMVVLTRRGHQSSDRGLMDSGHFGGLAWLAFYTGATLAVTLFDLRFESGFPKRWREMEIDGKFFYNARDVGGNIRESPARRQEV